MSKKPTELKSKSESFIYFKNSEFVDKGLHSVFNLITPKDLRLLLFSFISLVIPQVGWVLALWVLIETKTLITSKESMVAIFISFIVVLNSIFYHIVNYLIFGKFF